MKYPIGIQSFDQIIEDGYLYIDKTNMIYNLTHEGKIYFLSRPRRFGKSLLVSTLKNYFLGRKELFKGLKIDAMEKDWKVYPVFHMDFNGGEYTCPGALRDAITGYISDWEKEYCIEDGSRDINLGLRFKRILAQVHEQTGRRAVVLVLFGIQGGGRASAVRAADGGDEVLAGERVQRIQPAGRHKHVKGL